MKRILACLLSLYLCFPLPYNLSFSKQNFLAPLTGVGRAISLAPFSDQENEVRRLFSQELIALIKEEENELDKRYIRRAALAKFTDEKHEFQAPQAPFEVRFYDRVLSAINSLSRKERTRSNGVLRFFQKWEVRHDKSVSFKDDSGKWHVLVVYTSRDKEKGEAFVQHISETSHASRGGLLLPFQDESDLTAKKIIHAYYSRALQPRFNGGTQTLLEEAILLAARQQFLSREVRSVGEAGRAALLQIMQDRFSQGYDSAQLGVDMRDLSERDLRFRLEGDPTSPTGLTFVPPSEVAKIRWANAPVLAARLEGKYVVPFEELLGTPDFVNHSGGKGANLGELTNIAGVSVPQGITILNASYQQFINEARIIWDQKEKSLAKIIRAELAEIDYSDDVSFQSASRRIRQAFLQAYQEGKVPDAILEAIRTQVTALAERIEGRTLTPEEIDKIAWAVRSSGTREDLEDASSAGQQSSFLNTRGIASIIEKTVEDWASLWTGRAIAYRNGQILKSFLTIPDPKAEEVSPGLEDDDFGRLIAALEDADPPGEDENEYDKLIQDLRRTRNPEEKDADLDHKVVLAQLRQASVPGDLIERFQAIARDFTDPDSIGIAVVVQRQINSSRAYTMLTLDPATGWEGMVFNRVGNRDKELSLGKGRVFRVEFVYGLGEALVGNEATPDSFLVHKVGNRYNIIERTISPKLNMKVYVQDLLKKVGLSLEQGQKLTEAVSFPFLLGSLNLDRKKIDAIADAHYVYQAHVDTRHPEKGVDDYNFLEYLPFEGFKKEMEDGESENLSRLRLISNEIRAILEAPAGARIKTPSDVLERLAGSKKAKKKSVAQDQLIMLARAVGQAKGPWTGRPIVADVLGLPEEDVDRLVEVLVDINKEDKRTDVEVLDKDIPSGFDKEKLIALAHALRGLTKGEFTALTFTPAGWETRACVTDEEVIRVVQGGERIQNSYNKPMDIEGALDEEGQDWAIQARPITTKRETDDPDNLHLVKWLLTKEAKATVVATNTKFKDKRATEIADMIRSGKHEALTGLVLAKGKATKNAFPGLLIHIDDKKPVPLAQQLSEVEEASPEEGFPGHIILTRFTSPDYIAAMKRSQGVAAIEGGTTSHAAIVSRELGIATVVGIGEGHDGFPEWVYELLNEGIDIPVTVDANTGHVYFGFLPTRKQEKHISIPELNALDTKQLKFGLIGTNPHSFREVSKLNQHKGNKGPRLVRLEFILAEIGVPQRDCLAYDNLKLSEKAERGERLTLEELGALALLRSSPKLQEDMDRLAEDPDTIKKIEEKIEDYPSGVVFFKEKVREGLSAIAATHGLHQSVVIRTLDFKTNEMRQLIGGDLFEIIEHSPMIGERGLQREIDPRNQIFFEIFLEAFQSSVDEGYTNLGLMFPIVRHPDHLRTAISIMKRKKVRMKDFGIMVEIPSNVWLIDEFLDVLEKEKEEMAEGVFVSFGTNDLTQLTLGTGRDNAKLKYLFTESDPAVIRSIMHVASRAKQPGRNVELSLCGNAVNILIESIEKLEGFEVEGPKLRKERPADDDTSVGAATKRRETDHRLSEIEKEKAELGDKEKLIQAVTVIFQRLDSVGIDAVNYDTVVKRAAKYLAEAGAVGEVFEAKVPDEEPEPTTLHGGNGDYVRHDVDQLILELGLHPGLLLDFDRGALDKDAKDSPISNLRKRRIYRTSVARAIMRAKGAKTALDLFRIQVRKGILKSVPGAINRVVHGTTFMLTSDPNPDNRAIATEKRLPKGKVHLDYHLKGGEVYDPEEENPPLDFNGMSRNLTDYRDLFIAELQGVKEAAEKLVSKLVFLQLNGVRTLGELKQAFEIIAQVGLPENVRIGLGVHKASNAIIIDQMLEEKIPGEERGLSFVHLHAVRLAQEVLAADMYNDAIWLTQEQVEDSLRNPRRVIKAAVAAERGVVYLEDSLSHARPAKGKKPEVDPFDEQLEHWELLLQFLREQSGSFSIGSVTQLNNLVFNLFRFYESFYDSHIQDDREAQEIIFELVGIFDEYYATYDLAKIPGNYFQILQKGRQTFGELLARLDEDKVYSTARYVLDQVGTRYRAQNRLPEGSPTDYPGLSQNEIIGGSLLPPAEVAGALERLSSAGSLSHHGGSWHVASDVVSRKRRGLLDPLGFDLSRRQVMVEVAL